MKKGQKILVLEAFEGKQLKSVVAWDDRYIFVCRPEEFEAAQQENREPTCVGFRREFVVGPCANVSE